MVHVTNFATLSNLLFREDGRSGSGSAVHGRVGRVGLAEVVDMWRAVVAVKSVDYVRNRNESRLVVLDLSTTKITCVELLDKRGCMARMANIDGATEARRGSPATLSSKRRAAGLRTSLLGKTMFRSLSSCK